MQGILFRPEMIKAIVNGSKAVTRRLIKPQPDDKDGNMLLIGGRWKYDYTVAKEYARYRVGEVVYIKEAHYRLGYYKEKRFIPSFFRLQKGICFETPDILPISPHQVGWHKRSPLFMPEWAARTFIQITGVRAERLHEITEVDAMAEGVENMGQISAVVMYTHLWNSINSKNMWSSNPWVWVYQFKLVEKPK